MKKYVLTPTSLDESYKSTRTEAPEVPEAPMAPKRKHIFPATRREMLRDRIEDLEDELHRIFADPNIPTFIKLKRHGDLLQAYRETYAELNKPLFAPPFSSEYLGPLPREGKQEEKREESVNEILASLFAKAEEEEEEEEKTVNASRIMAKLSPAVKTRESIGSSRYGSPVAPFVSPQHFATPPQPLPEERSPKAKPRPRYSQPTLASLREPRVTKKPSRFGFGKEGLVRRPRPYV